MRGRARISKPVACRRARACPAVPRVRVEAIERLRRVAASADHVGVYRSAWNFGRARARARAEAQAP
jgi:hypothetical protein